MKKVIIDTSFWLLPFEKKIDLFGQLERVLEEPYSVIVPQAVMNELSAMARGRGKRAIPAKSALRVIGQKMKQGAVPKIEISPEKGRADGAIITTALQHAGSAVATNDYLLRKRLREKKIRSLSLHDGNMVGFS